MYLIESCLSCFQHSKRILCIAQTTQLYDQLISSFLCLFRLICFSQKQDLLFTPFDTFIIIPCDTFSGLVHDGKLLHRLWNTCFRCTFDQLTCPLCIDFNIDPVQIGKTYQEIMLLVLIVGFDSHCLDLFQKGGAEFIVLFPSHTGRKSFIILIKSATVSLLHLHRQHRLFLLHCSWVFRSHDVVDFVHKVRCHDQRKKVAPFKHLTDRLVEVLAGSKELIVPDGNIAVLKIAMDQSHKLLCLSPVLLAVAQENIGVKSRTDLFGQLVVDEYRLDVSLQYFIKSSFGLIPVVGIKVLQVAKIPGKQISKAMLHHKGQHRDVLFLRQR